MEVFENIKMAFSALLGNKLRSSLTMVGIAIGNASVIAMVAVGQGAQKLTAEQFESLGPNVLFISLTSPRIRRTYSNEARPLVVADAEAIASQVPTVDAVAPEIHTSQLIDYRGRTLNSSSVIGTTPEFLKVRNYRLDRGRFLNEIDLRRNNRVVVLGAEVAGRLFARENPVGQRLRIRNISFEVIGVLAPKGSLFGSNQDDRAVVPLTTASHQLIGRRTSPYGIPITLVALTARSQESLKAAEFQVKNFLQLRHPNSREDDIRVHSQNSILETAEETDAGLAAMLGAIAGISLFVGGIGVMNIMLVSVTERTQEIGLRKAIGAKEKDILLQFLIEAVILATVGGMSGIVLGVGGIAIASSFSPLATSLSFPSLVLALGVSGGIGLFFGVVPAQRAARLDPIVALRSAS